MRKQIRFEAFCKAFVEATRGYFIETMFNESLFPMMLMRAAIDGA